MPLFTPVKPDQFRLGEDMPFHRLFALCLRVAGLTCSPGFDQPGEGIFSYNETDIPVTTRSQSPAQDQVLYQIKSVEKFDLRGAHPTVNWGG